jgi:hypothetical protein
MSVPPPPPNKFPPLGATDQQVTTWLKNSDLDVSMEDKYKFVKTKTNILNDWVQSMDNDPITKAEFYRIAPDYKHPKVAAAPAKAAAKLGAAPMGAAHKTAAAADSSKKVPGATAVPENLIAALMAAQAKKAATATTSPPLTPDKAPAPLAAAAPHVADAPHVAAAPKTAASAPLAAASAPLAAPAPHVAPAPKGAADAPGDAAPVLSSDKAPAVADSSTSHGDAPAAVAAADALYKEILKLLAGDTYEWTPYYNDQSDSNSGIKQMATQEYDTYEKAVNACNDLLRKGVSVNEYGVTESTKKKKQQKFRVWVKPPVEFGTTKEEYTKNITDLKKKLNEPKPPATGSDELEYYLKLVRDPNDYMNKTYKEHIEKDYSGYSEQMKEFMVIRLFMRLAERIIEGLGKDHDHIKLLGELNKKITELANQENPKILDDLEKKIGGLLGLTPRDLIVQPSKPGELYICEINKKYTDADQANSDVKKLRGGGFKGAMSVNKGNGFIVKVMFPVGSLSAGAASSGSSLLTPHARIPDVSTDYKYKDNQHPQFPTINNNWFKNVFGFDEGGITFDKGGITDKDREQIIKFHTDSPVIQKLEVNSSDPDNISIIDKGGKSKKYNVGKVKFVSTGSLLQSIAKVDTPLTSNDDGLKYYKIQGNAGHLHYDPQLKGSLFQAASQFNALEMVSQYVIPEQGITMYKDDRTQGPACALACPYATLYRNYFSMPGDKPQSGIRDSSQNTSDQINALEEFEKMSGITLRKENGYFYPKDATEAKKINVYLTDPEHFWNSVKLVKYFIHEDTPVVSAIDGYVVQNVAQIYCSALPLDYKRDELDGCPLFIKMILCAIYYATFAQAVVMAQTKKERVKVLITGVGGGVFGNPKQVINAAINSALTFFKDYPIDVYYVDFYPDVTEFINPTEAIKEDKYPGNAYEKITPPSYFQVGGAPVVAASTPVDNKPFVEVLDTILSTNTFDSVNTPIKCNEDNGDLKYENPVLEVLLKEFYRPSSTSDKDLFMHAYHFCRNMKNSFDILTPTKNDLLKKMRKNCFLLTCGNIEKSVGAVLDEEDLIPPALQPKPAPAPAPTSTAAPGSPDKSLQQMIEYYSQDGGATPGEKARFAKLNIRKDPIMNWELTYQDQVYKHNTYKKDVTSIDRRFTKGIDCSLTNMCYFNTALQFLLCNQDFIQLLIEGNCKDNFVSSLKLFKHSEEYKKKYRKSDCNSDDFENSKKILNALLNFFNTWIKSSTLDKTALTPIIRGLILDSKITNEETISEQQDSTEMIGKIYDPLLCIDSEYTNKFLKNLTFDYTEKLSAPYDINNKPLQFIPAQDEEGNDKVKIEKKTSLEIKPPLEFILDENFIAKSFEQSFTISEVIRNEKEKGRDSKFNNTLVDGSVLKNNYNIIISCKRWLRPLKVVVDKEATTQTKGLEIKKFNDMREDEEFKNFIGENKNKKVFTDTTFTKDVFSNLEKIHINFSKSPITSAEDVIKYNNSNNNIITDTYKNIDNIENSILSPPDIYYTSKNEITEVNKYLLITFNRLVRILTTGDFAKNFIEIIIEPKLTISNKEFVLQGYSLHLGEGGGHYVFVKCNTETGIEELVLDDGHIYSVEELDKARAAQKATPPIFPEDVRPRNVVAFIYKQVGEEPAPDEDDAHPVIPPAADDAPSGEDDKTALLKDYTDILNPLLQNNFSSLKTDSNFLTNCKNYYTQFGTYISNALDAFGIKVDVDFSDEIPPETACGGVMDGNLKQFLKRAAEVITSLLQKIDTYAGTLRDNETLKSDNNTKDLIISLTSVTKKLAMLSDFADKCKGPDAAPAAAEDAAAPAALGDSAETPAAHVFTPKPVAAPPPPPPPPPLAPLKLGANKGPDAAPAAAAKAGVLNSIVDPEQVKAAKAKAQAVSSKVVEKELPKETGPFLPASLGLDDNEKEERDWFKEHDYTWRDGYNPSEDDKEWAKGEIEDAKEFAPHKPIVSPAAALPEPDVATDAPPPPKPIVSPAVAPIPVVSGLIPVVKLSDTDILKNINIVLTRLGHGGALEDSDITLLNKYYKDYNCDKKPGDKDCEKITKTLEGDDDDDWGGGGHIKKKLLRKQQYRNLNDVDNKTSRKKTKLTEVFKSKKNNRKTLRSK